MEWSLSRETGAVDHMTEHTNQSNYMRAQFCDYSGRVIGRRWKMGGSRSSRPLFCFAIILLLLSGVYTTPLRIQQRSAYGIIESALNTEGAGDFSSQHGVENEKKSSAELLGEENVEHHSPGEREIHPLPEHEKKREEIAEENKLGLHPPEQENKRDQDKTENSDGDLAENIARKTVIHTENELEEHPPLHEEAREINPPEEEADNSEDRSSPADAGKTTVGNPHKDEREVLVSNNEDTKRSERVHYSPEEEIEREEHPPSHEDKRKVDSPEKDERREETSALQEKELVGHPAVDEKRNEHGGEDHPREEEEERKDETEKHPLGEVKKRGQHPPHHEHKRVYPGIRAAGKEGHSTLDVMEKNNEHQPLGEEGDEKRGRHPPHQEEDTRVYQGIGEKGKEKPFSLEEMTKTDDHPPLEEEKRGIHPPHHQEEERNEMITAEDHPPRHEEQEGGIHPPEHERREFVFSNLEEIHPPLEEKGIIHPPHEVEEEEETRAFHPPSEEEKEEDEEEEEEEEEKEEENKKEKEIQSSIENKESEIRQNSEEERVHPPNHEIDEEEKRFYLPNEMEDEREDFEEKGTEHHPPPEYRRSFPHEYETEDEEEGERHPPEEEEEKGEREIHSTLDETKRMNPPYEVGEEDDYSLPSKEERREEHAALNGEVNANVHPPEDQKRTLHRPQHDHHEDEENEFHPLTNEKDRKIEENIKREFTWQDEEDGRMHEDAYIGDGEESELPFPVARKSRIHPPLHHQEHEIEEREIYPSVEDEELTHKREVVPEYPMNDEEERYIRALDKEIRLRQLSDEIYTRMKRNA